MLYMATEKTFVEVADLIISNLHVDGVQVEGKGEAPTMAISDWFCRSGQLEACVLGDVAPWKECSLDVGIGIGPFWWR